MVAPLPKALEKHPFEGVDEETRESARKLAVWSEKPESTKQRTKTIADGAWEKACNEARAMMRSADWNEATPRHFVAAYAMLHERVYGAAPGELTPTVRLQAAGAAGRMLKQEFDGDNAQMAAFLHWTWMREKGREDWRRANRREGGRIGWRLQFNGSLLTDYRVDKARKAGR
jgi:hypothetical protein